MKTQTDTWTLQEAAIDLREVVRRALDDQPQVVVRGEREEDAVVVVARAEYERLKGPSPSTAPGPSTGLDLLAFFQRSPLAEAVRDGLLRPEDLCMPREVSTHRELDWSDAEP